MGGGGGSVGEVNVVNGSVGRWKCGKGESVGEMEVWGR